MYLPGDADYLTVTAVPQWYSLSLFVNSVVVVHFCAQVRFHLSILDNLLLPNILYLFSSLFSPGQTPKCSDRVQGRGATTDI